MDEGPEPRQEELTKCVVALAASAHELLAEALRLTEEARVSAEAVAVDDHDPRLLLDYCFRPAPACTAHTASRAK